MGNTYSTELRQSKQITTIIETNPKPPYFSQPVPYFYQPSKSHGRLTIVIVCHPLNHQTQQSFLSSLQNSLNSSSSLNSIILNSNQSCITASIDIKEIDNDRKQSVLQFREWYFLMRCFGNEVRRLMEKMNVIGGEEEGQEQIESIEIDQMRIEKFMKELEILYENYRKKGEYERLMEFIECEDGDYLEGFDSL